MNNIKTCELVEELEKREGVQHICINPEEEINILLNKKEQVLKVNKGPVRILVIYD